MPAEDVVRKVGRIEYIEPNNLFANSVNDTVQNGIPQPYEDYSFSVNLRVINGNRYDCGMTSEGEDMAKNVLEFSSDNGTISFMDGTSVGGQGYLTTNFTDISMNNPETNTKECLGIENISIKYDSWYYPTVEIKFVDVRGASLMLPAEYEYYNNGNPSKDNTKSHALPNSNFFKAFFSFPYPLFKLSVKGFYGKEVTYDLSVLKCNINFNSSTGNFEMNTSFIGYMYGMYADLPFSFLYVAPYIDMYGKNTWDEKKSTGDFCYIPSNKSKTPGREMYTFPELKRAVENAEVECEKVIKESVSGITETELKTLTERLEQNVYFRYPMTNWGKWQKNNSKSGYFFISTENTNDNNRKIYEEFYKFASEYKDYNDYAASDSIKYCKGHALPVKDIFEYIYTESKKIKEKKSLQKTEDGGKNASEISKEISPEEVNRILSDVVANLVFHADESNKDKPVLVFDAGESTFGSSKKQSDYQPLIDELKTRFDNNEINSPMQQNTSVKKWTIKAFAFDNMNFKNEILDVINKLKSDLSKLQASLEEKRKLDISKAIGFDPTLRNLYNMTFAHVDTFMSVFYNTLDRIRKSIQSDDDSRKFETLCGSNGSGGIQVDVNENTLANSQISHGGKLPPFTMFYKEESVKDSKDKKLTSIWPGSLNGGDKLDEVQLVESIINATLLNKRRQVFVTPKDNIIEKKGDNVPINYYDVINNERNPYLDVLTEKNMSAREVAKVFILRCYYSMLNGSYVSPNSGSNKNGLANSVANYTEKAKLIAKLEVENIIRAFQILKSEPNDKFIDELNKISNNGASVISEFLTGNKPTFTSAQGDKDLSYSWIKNKGDEMLFYLLPLGTFNNSTLSNYLTGANLKKDSDKFLKINQYGTAVNAYGAHIYSGGKHLENVFTKYTDGDYAEASRLFKNFKTVPETISGITFFEDTESWVAKISSDKLLNPLSLLNESIDKLSIKSLYERIGNEPGPEYLPKVPSGRRTSAGYTSIFMDPLYYAQTSKEARAYLFLMGVPYGKDKDFFLPDKLENGDYPTIMLLREGALYWRTLFMREEIVTGSMVSVENDPITYTYNINNVVYNVLQDIEKNDPCLGVKYALNYFNSVDGKVSNGRKNLLMKYFLNWANGVDTEIPATVTGDTYIDLRVPSPNLDFQSIERMLALWERHEIGFTSIKNLLTPESCYAAVMSGSSFANIDTLKSIYIMGSDGLLGRADGKIRTNVFINTRISDTPSEKEAGDFLKKFSKFYYGFDTVLDYANIGNGVLTVPRNAMNDAVSAFISGLKEAYDVSIDKLKNSKGINSLGRPDDSQDKPEAYKDENLKLACYIALKNLYDRWLCSRRRETWNFSINQEKLEKNSNIKSDFSRFFYVDEFYHDIGMVVRPDLSKFVDNTSSMGGFTDDSDANNLAAVSLMKILSMTADFAGCSILTLPTPLGLARSYYYNDDNSVLNVFKAFPYNEAVRSNDVESSFVILYTSQKSSSLDNQNDSGTYAYKSDGFDIANTWGDIVVNPMFSDGDEDSYVVPSFGVTFAKQNQSYFKDIQLSMEDHQITEYSIRNEIKISYQNNMGPKETTILGQDLYSVFSNYSYSCSVTMMGDAQITPLMYFQLNNIPMWKGAYMITNVHHDISPHGMETVFSGVRQAMPTLPYKDENVVEPPDPATGQNTPAFEPEEGKEPTETGIVFPERPLDKIDVEKVEHIVLVIERVSVKKMPEGYNFIDGILSARVYMSGETTPQTFDYIANTLEPYTALKGKIENFVPDDNETYFAIPSGRYSKVLVENIPVNQEYRDTNDSFYKFTNGKHILITESNLKDKNGVRLYCEMVTGKTSMDNIDGGGIQNICFGNTCPILLQGDDPNDINKQFNEDEIRATYREVFDLIRRMNEAKKPITLFIKETDGLPTKEIK